MPIYEYLCQDCVEKFEVLTPVNQRTAAKMCPSCSGTNVEVLLSRFASPTTGSEQTSVGSTGGCACGGSCSCGAN